MEQITTAPTPRYPEFAYDAQNATFICTVLERVFACKKSVALLAAEYGDVRCCGTSGTSHDMSNTVLWSVFFVVFVRVSRGALQWNITTYHGVHNSGNVCAPFGLSRRKKPRCFQLDRESSSRTHCPAAQMSCTACQKTLTL